MWVRRCRATTWGRAPQPTAIRSYLLSLIVIAAKRPVIPVYQPRLEGIVLICIDDGACLRTSPMLVPSALSLLPYFSPDIPSDCTICLLKMRNRMINGARAIVVAAMTSVQLPSNWV